MLYMLNEIMTPREASDRWGVSMNSLHMKLSRLRESDLFHQLIQEGKAKYYKPEGKVRGEWLLTVEAMQLLFPKVEGELKGRQNNSLFVNK
ncbi:hypothetical protein COE50_06185 [Bacillus anthracis]|nr:hypothetical protein COE50_06185 [Bacillus anthracis]